MPEMNFYVVKTNKFEKTLDKTRKLKEVAKTQNFRKSTTLPAKLWKKAWPTYPVLPPFFLQLRLHFFEEPADSTLG